MVVGKRIVTAGVGAILALGMAACGSQDSGGSDGEITVGASLPFSGPLGPYGALMKQGYEYTIDKVNAEGGLDVGGEKRKVRLVTLDNQTNPQQAAQQVRRLVTRNRIDAMLGAVTAPLIVPQALAAEALGVPYVSSLMAPEEFEAANKRGWKNAWLFFFGTDEATSLQFPLADKVPNNKTAAVLVASDNGVPPVFRTPDRLRP